MNGQLQMLQENFNSLKRVVTSMSVQSEMKNEELEKLLNESNEMPSQIISSPVPSNINFDDSYITEDQLEGYVKREDVSSLVSQLIDQKLSKFKADIMNDVMSSPSTNQSQDEGVSRQVAKDEEAKQQQQKEQQSEIVKLHTTNNQKLSQIEGMISNLRGEVSSLQSSHMDVEEELTQMKKQSVTKSLVMELIEDSLVDFDGGGSGTVSLSDEYPPEEEDLEDDVPIQSSEITSIVKSQVEKSTSNLSKKLQILERRGKETNKSLEEMEMEFSTLRKDVRQLDQTIQSNLNNNINSTGNQSSSSPSNDLSNMDISSLKSQLEAEFVTRNQFEEFEQNLDQNEKLQIKLEDLETSLNIKLDFISQNTISEIYEKLMDLSTSLSKVESTTTHHIRNQSEMNTKVESDFDHMNEMVVGVGTRVDFLNDKTTKLEKLVQRLEDSMLSQSGDETFVKLQLDFQTLFTNLKSGLDAISSNISLNQSPLIILSKTLNTTTNSFLNDLRKFNKFVPIALVREGKEEESDPEWESKQRQKLKSMQASLLEDLDEIVNKCEEIDKIDNQERLVLGTTLDDIPCINPSMSIKQYIKRCCDSSFIALRANINISQLARQVSSIEHKVENCVENETLENVSNELSKMVRSSGFKER